MNSTIKKLQEKSTTSQINGNFYGTHQLDLEKFAKLIVNECCKNLRSVADTQNTLGQMQLGANSGEQAFYTYCAIQGFANILQEKKIIISPDSYFVKKELVDDDIGKFVGAVIKQCSNLLENYTNNYNKDHKMNQYLPNAMKHSQICFSSLTQSSQKIKMTA